MKSLICALFALSSAAMAKPLIREAREESENGVEGRAGSGIGTFQDIQVPLNEQVGVRADGHNVSEEGATHVGIPVWVGLSATRRSGALSYQLGLDALRLSASSGPTDTQSATYTRFDATASVRYAFNVLGLRAALGGGAGVRRSVFSNVSNGHYFQAPVVSGNASLGGRDLSVTLSGAYAPTAAFGYYDGSMFSGDAFKKRKTSLSEVALSSSYLIREDVFLDFGLSREAAQVTIEDVAEYDAFGLQVSPTAEVSRSISVATTIARIGFHKSF